VSSRFSTQPILYPTNDYSLEFFHYIEDSPEAGRFEFIGASSSKVLGLILDESNGLTLTTKVDIPVSEGLLVMSMTADLPDSAD
jgi:hypothetical protein